MNKITFPLEPGMQGPEVTDLQDALQLVISNAAVLRDSEGIRRELAARLREERAHNIYSDGTRAIVEYFQSERGLEAHGIVDEPTAVALNALLRQWGQLAEEQAPRAYVVSGRVTRADGAPARGAALRAFHDDERGAAVRLGDDAADGDGNYTIRYELLPEVAAIRLRVAVLGEDGRPLQSSEPIVAAGPLEIVNLTLPAVPEPRPQRTLDGRVVLEHGLPAEGLTLRLYRREVGCAATPLADTITGAGGAYTFAYEVGRGASLEVRAVQIAADGAEHETVLSKPLNFLGAQAAQATVNLAAPSALQPPAAEYARLAADLTAQVGAMAQLTAVQENAQCQDLTVLNRATGWDARLIALAATTERLSAEPDVALPQGALYGLLRAGLPFDKLQLAQLDADAAAQVLTRVRDAGLVALDDDAISRFKDDFTEFKGRVRLSLPMPGSAESYGTMLRASGLDEAAQNEFARAYFKPRAGNVRLLDAAREAGLGEPEIARLQLQGKLAFLAGNSAPMTAHLAQKLAQQNSDDPALLVEEDLYDAANWKAEIEGLAAGDAAALAALIPAAYTGTPEERLDAYAAEMARKVRLSYPTQVLARKVEVNDADPFRLGDGRGDTARLLKSAAAQGFRLGRTPVEAFFRQAEARNAAGGVEPVADAAVPGVARQQIKQLQRTYQITLNDEGMEVLAALDLRSAHDVTALAEAEFAARYDSKYFDLFGKHPPKQEGTRIHRKARQVISFTYNLFTVAKTLESTPAVRGFSAPAAQAGRREQMNGLLKHYPTLEQLFGSQDFCDCEHCRSVLSPAAYLVDLLQYVDAAADVEQRWATFLSHWEQNHGGQGYPHKGADGQPMTPYDVLIERRPDLPHIPLTCENTNIALPYIDIVNEILEYYVANDRLAADAARDTGDAAVAELLAEPQNVIRSAYDKVLEAHYPLALPFDLWLETVRQFCAYFETPAARLLDLLRPTDSLFDSRQPYDRAAIFAESLGLSPAEWGIFTDRDPLAGDEWIELYGYLPVSTAIRDPANAINATLAVADSDAARLSAGLPCTYFDVDVGALHTETKIIAEIGGPGSGGPGLTAVTFTGVWDTPPAADDLLTPDVPAALQSAKTLARRLGVTYREIVEIVRTGFVNPELERLTLLYKLGIPIHSVLLWRDAANQAFFAANRDLLDVERADLAAADQGRFDALTVDDWQKLRELQAYRGLLLWWDAASRERYAANRDLLDRLRDDLPPANQARFDALTPEDWQRLRAMRPHEGRAQDFARFGLKLDDLKAALEAPPFGAILVLADPDAGCNFDETTLRYADGRRADALAFLRINLFVRLWRKLGWSIEETDHALQAFVPGGTLTEGNLGDEQDEQEKHPLATALVYLAHLKTLSERLRVGKQSRLKLITLWADIPTTGKNSLYAQLFLSRTVLKDDDVFDHPWGLYLDPAWIAQQAATRAHAVELAGVAAALDPAPFAARPDLAERLALHYDSLQETQHLAYTGILSDDDKAALLALAPSDALAQLLDAAQGKAREFSLVKGHLLALQGALGLGADEVRCILADDGKDLETEPLSLPAVSLLYRYGLLGKALQLSVPDLITLKALSDRNPFTPLHPAPVQTLNEDHPYTQTLAFVDVADAAKGSGLTVADLDYLLRHRFDPTGPLRPNREAALALLKTLAAGVQAIRAEHAVPADPGALADETLHQKLGLALPPDVAARFVAMLDGKVEFAANEAQMKAFFDKHLLKQAGKPPTTGFLAAGDFSLLFDPQYDFEGENIGDQEKARRRRAALVHAFLPYLQDRLVRQFIVQAITADAGASAGAEPALVESLLTDARLLVAGGGPLLNAFAALGARGVSAAFDGAGAVTLAEANTALKPAAGAADAARFAGYLEVPNPGAYRFTIHLGQPNATAELRFDHLPDPLWLARKAADPPNHVLGQGDAEFMELRAGVLYRFGMDVAGLNGQGARLEVQGETLPQGGLGQLALYPAETLDAAERALLLLQKALRLLQALGLNERAARHLLTHAADFGNVNLSLLPTAADAPADPPAAAARFAAFLRLAAYARLQREMAGGTDGLIGIFEAAAVAAAEDDVAAHSAKLDQVYARIGELVRRDPAAVKAAARALAAQPAFPNEEPLQRLWDLLQVVERFGVPVAALLRWVRIVSPAATPEQRFAIARDLRAAIKARFEPEAWQRVARPIFDALRRRQRDALVAYIAHRRGFAGMEELYEFFLIDPGTEPVVQTSRIRLAIASVQLFIQRCLLNLEAHVHPSAILNPGQWEWMKRYRVWEANRKIFLFPENWLEPEFRDDKTHLFAELEGALLQGDVSQDLAEDAFYTYLKKLEEIARLEVVAMHLEEGDTPADNTLHVIGRTHEQPHKYFYRRYADSMWTPWEPVSAEIEGDHLAPVVWRDRLYLFWVTFLEKPLPGETPEIDVSQPISIAGPTKDVEAHLHWSEYLHGEWSAPASSDVTKPSPVRFAGLSSFDSSKVFVHVARESAPGAGEEGGVFIHLSGTATRPPPNPPLFTGGQAKADRVTNVIRPISAWLGSGTADRTETIEGAFYLAGRNSPPEGSYYAAPPAIPYGLTNRGATRYRGSGALKVTYKQRITTEPGKTPKPETQDILRKKGGAYSLLACNNEITLGAPTLAQLAGADNPAAVKKAIEDGLAEIAALMKPVFYQDSLRTLFIEPNVVERTVEEWQEWITPTPQPGVSVPEWLLDDNLFKEHIGPKYVFTPPGPDDYFDPFSPVINFAESVAKVRPGTDWLVNGATALLFDGQVIGPHGGVEVALLPASQAAGAVAQGGAPLSVHPGSSVAADQVAVAAGAAALAASGLAVAPGGLNLIGGDGFNAALQQNFSAFNASNLGSLAHAGSRFGG